MGHCFDSTSMKTIATTDGRCGNGSCSRPIRGVFGVARPSRLWPASDGIMSCTKVTFSSLPALLQWKSNSSSPIRRRRISLRSCMGTGFGCSTHRFLRVSASSIRTALIRRPCPQGKTEVAAGGAQLRSSGERPLRWWMYSSATSLPSTPRRRRAPAAAPFRARLTGGARHTSTEGACAIAGWIRAACAPRARGAKRNAPRAVMLMPSSSRLAA